MSDPARQRPVQTIPLIQPLMLVFDRGLYPDLEWNSKERLKFDDFEIGRDATPVMMPANNAVAFFRVVAMRPEAARSKLKLNPDSLFGVARVPVGNAIRITCANFFDAELQPFGNLRKQENYTQFILGSIFQRRIFER